MLFSSWVRASEEDLYDFLWLDPDKSVYVLQKKVYKKKGTFFLDLGLMKNSSSDFQSSYGYRSNTGYYFFEEWALQLYYAGYANSNNDSYDNLKQIGREPFIRKAKTLYGGGVLWSPFYGKINTFNKIVYFDWSFGLGYGKITTESNKETAADQTQLPSYENESYSAISASSQIRFYINRNFNLHLGYANTVYSAPGPTINGVVGKNLMRTSSDVNLGVGFAF